MSKILSALLGLMMVITCCACNDDTVGGDSTNDGDAQAPACLNSSDCDRAEICIAGECLTYCSDEVPCGKGICDVTLHACVIEDEDGDSASGNCNTDGCPNGFYCHSSTGVCIPNSGGDGETQPDGDVEEEEVICPEIDCVPLMYELDEESCTCVPSAAHCINAGCPDNKQCNEESGSCDGGNLWPGMCANCYSDSDCPSEGSVCSRALETQEHFCAPTCRSADPVCPPDSSCSDVSAYMGLPEPYWVCLPDSNTCGNPHMTGGACASDNDCSDELYCITETGNDFDVIFPSGYCSRLCESDGDCLAGSRCTGIKVGNETIRTCMTLCEHKDNDCRNDYTCYNVASQAICIPDDMVP